MRVPERQQQTFMESLGVAPNQDRGSEHDDLCAEVAMRARFVFAEMVRQEHIQPPFRPTDATGTVIKGPYVCTPDDLYSEDFDGCVIEWPFHPTKHERIDGEDRRGWNGRYYTSSVWIASSVDTKKSVAFADVMIQAGFDTRSWVWTEVKTAIPSVGETLRQLRAYNGLLKARQDEAWKAFAATRCQMHRNQESALKAGCKGIHEPWQVDFSEHAPGSFCVLLVLGPRVADKAAFFKTQGVAVMDSATLMANPVDQVPEDYWKAREGPGDGQKPAT